ncbi:MAG: GGDEF domain-containing protein [Proteobacteria bacterium]|nr:GGDEF domain-containing protein [Pseudomonadota bacterium]MBU1595029.1 GGDEF domain-containing protein [Pseudomonadota bacterium]
MRLKSTLLALALLQTVADRLRGLLRKADTLARVGGDEFMFLLPDIGSVEDAKATAGKVLDRLAAPFELEGHLVPVSFSLGIALFPEDGRDAETLVRSADKAMYRAKAKGRSLRSSHVCVSRK